jgi:hypothetical protein
VCQANPRRFSAAIIITRNFLAVAEIVFEFVAVIFYHVQASVPIFHFAPPQTTISAMFAFGDGQALDPGHGVFEAAFPAYNLEGKATHTARITDRWHGVIDTTERSSTMQYLCIRPPRAAFLNRFISPSLM